MRFDEQYGGPYSYAMRLQINRPYRDQTKGAFFWDYSGIGIHRIDGICDLLGAIPFSE